MIARSIADAVHHVGKTRPASALSRNGLAFSTWLTASSIERVIICYINFQCVDSLESTQKIPNSKPSTFLSMEFHSSLSLWWTPNQNFVNDSRRLSHQLRWKSILQERIVRVNVHVIDPLLSTRNVFVSPMRDRHRRGQRSRCPRKMTRSFEIWEKLFPMQWVGFC